MNQTERKKLQKLLKKQRKKTALNRLVMCMAAVVVSVTTYMLILPAITMSNDTFCGQDHEHVQQCYSDPAADIETAADWEMTLPADLTGNIDDDILAIAESQLGYKESEKNYIVKNGEQKGYTRYGEWFGQPYEDWAVTFAAFCLEYAGVDESMMPRDADCQQWINMLQSYGGKFTSSSEYMPSAGNIIFLDNNRGGKFAGVVAGVSEDKTSVKVIEGDSLNEVRYVSYEITDPSIIGYGSVSGNTVEEAQTDTNIESEVSLPEGQDLSTHEVLSYQDENVEINVTLPDDADIPENSKLQVKQLSTSDKGYVENAGVSELSSNEYILEHSQYNVALVSNDGYVDLQNEEVVVEMTYQSDEAVDGEEVQARITAVSEDESEVIQETDISSSGTVASSFTTRRLGNYDVMLVAKTASSGLAEGRYGNFQLKYNSTKDAFVSDPAYSKYYNVNSPLGTAGSFHLVGFGTVNLNTHTNGNILANVLNAGTNFGTNNYSNELSYIKTYQKVNGGSASMGGHILVLGSDNQLSLVDNNNAIAVSGTKLDKPYNVVQDRDSDAQPFIDLDRVETEVAGLSKRMAAAPNTGVTKEFGDMNNSYFNLNTPDGAGFYSMTVGELSNIKGRKIKMKGFESGKNGTIVINIDCSAYKGTGKTVYMPEEAIVTIDGQDQGTGEVTEFSAGKVIWNFINAEGLTIEAYRMSGMVVALGATVNINQNLNGTVVAEHVYVKAESHRTDFTGDIELPYANAAAGPYMRVRKVDSDNISLYLNGAEFDLYKWNSSKGQYVKEKTGLCYDDGDALIIDSLTYNNAYRLIETKAPPGYAVSSEPYDFIVTNSNTSKYPVYKPSDFNGRELNNGQTLYYKNKQMTAFVIEKQWLSGDGTPAEPEESQIIVDIWRNVYTNEECTALHKLEEYRTGITVKASDDWRFTIDDLPAEGTAMVNGYSKKVYYTYFVKEQAGEGYNVSYRGNTGIVNGTVTIINQKSEEYVLPETGGPGTYVYMAGGILLMAVAGILILRRRKLRS